MPRIVLDGARIFYTDEGRGEALILVHGWIGSGALWDLMVPELARDFRVVAPDLPGHGDSGIPGGFSFLLEGFSRFLEELREALDLPRFTLVGHSMGGCIALHYAARYPQRVPALVLIDTPSLSRSISWLARLPLLEWALGLVHRFWGPKMVAFSIRSSVRHPERLPSEWLRAAVVRACGLERRAFLETTRMLRHLDLEDELGRVDAPALLIHGEEDRSVKLPEAERLREALPRARLRVIPDCGHCPNYEYPGEVCGMIREFLASPPP
ncbi:MAG: alpha/beta fold hydrolase [Actinomycetota bacterium]